ncbi:MAG: ATP-binding protein [Acidimicrobiia bacterium]
MNLGVHLPRQLLSVPVLRHLSRRSMEELGVVAEDAADVELALAEACANVIKHSGPGDAYDVELDFGLVERVDGAAPAILCSIRVTDVGHGFDFASLDALHAGADAENGRGVALMRALMDHIRFDSEPETGTVVHLTKTLRCVDTAPTRTLTHLPP